MQARAWVFRDRADAGRRLAERLARWAGRDDVLVLALPRGGVPVGAEIARRLQAPLDVFIVRKLGLPGYPELAMGALASGGIRTLNPDVIDTLGIPASVVDIVAEREAWEIERRERAYRGDRTGHDVAGHVVILVDDGIATGSTVRAAARAIRARSPGRLIIATPVAPAGTRPRMEAEADEFVCLHEPTRFLALSTFYGAFPQLTDDEVREQLARAPRPAVRP